MAVRRDHSALIGANPEPPSWYDQGGAPRWGAFDPAEAGGDACGGRAHREAALAEVACDGCGATVMAGATARHGVMATPAAPDASCCGRSGEMPGVVLRVAEYWRLERGGWRRRPALEGPALS